MFAAMLYKLRIFVLSRWKGRRMLFALRFTFFGIVSENNCMYEYKYDTTAHFDVTIQQSDVNPSESCQSKIELPSMCTLSK